MRLISTPTTANSVKPAIAPEPHREGAACGSIKNQKTLSALSAVAREAGPPAPDSGGKHDGERKRQIRCVRAENWIERQAGPRGSQYNGCDNPVPEHRGAIFGQ